MWDDAAEYCPGGTPYYDDGCDTGLIGRDEPDESFVSDRSLDGTRFERETGYQPPKWHEMLEELAIQVRKRDQACR